MGEIGFQFVRKFRGNVVFNGRIESTTHKGHYNCVYDDGDRKTYSPGQMNKLKAKNYPDLMDVKELDSCRHSFLNDGSSSDMSPGSTSSDSENETITLLQTRLRKKKRIQVEASASESESDGSSSSEDKSDSSSSEDESDSSSSEDESDDDYEEKQDEDEDGSSVHDNSCVDATGIGRAGKVDGRVGAKTKQSRAPKQTAAPATNWAYGSWLMGKSLEELQNMTRADELYLKTMKKVRILFRSACRA